LLCRVFRSGGIKKLKLLVLGYGLITCAVIAQPLPCLDLQGHRGMRGLLPENSMAAFKRAIELGVTTIEADLVLSADGQILVHHDLRLNANYTRDASGRWLTDPTPVLIDTDSKTLGTFNIGSINPASAMAKQWPEQQALANQSIPLLSDVLQLAAQAPYPVRLNLETKLSPLLPQQSANPMVFAQKLMQSLQQSGLAQRTTIQSFDWRTLLEVKRIAPQQVTACLSFDSPNNSTVRPDVNGVSPWHGGLSVQEAGSVPAVVKQAGCAIWSMAWQNLNATNYAQARSLGLQIIPWTVNDLQTQQTLSAMGVDGLITDYPNRWIEAQKIDSSLRPVCKPQ
jgi:glycerophosphoryl diester phosphodiesterase